MANLYYIHREMSIFRVQGPISQRDLDLPKLLAKSGN